LYRKLAEAIKNLEYFVTYLIRSVLRLVYYLLGILCRNSIWLMVILSSEVSWPVSLAAQDTYRN